MIKMGAKNLLSHSLKIARKDLIELFRNKLGLADAYHNAAVNDGDDRFYLSIQRQLDKRYACCIS